ncbi:transposase [candidate division KSB1 bacterium]|nr:transposase [candidate division KSB1 bacterium]
MAQESGVQFGSIQVIDSVHSTANVNTAKDKRRKDIGKEPHDPDAHWGAKHKRKFKTESGKEVEQTEYSFGYKSHVSLNVEAGLITSLEITTEEAYDGKHFCSLVDRDLKQELPISIYAGDKGYDDSNNHFYLEYRGLHSVICLKDNRTKKKDKYKEIWLALIETPQYKQEKKNATRLNGNLVRQNKVMVWAIVVMLVRPDSPCRPILQPSC